MLRDDLTSGESHRAPKKNKNGGPLSIEKRFFQAKKNEKPKGDPTMKSSFFMECTVPTKTTDGTLWLGIALKKIQN